MDSYQWMSVVASLVVAVTSIIAIIPEEDNAPVDDTIITELDQKDVVYIHAKYVFVDSGQTYVMDINKNIYKINSSIVIYYNEKSGAIHDRSN